MDVAKQIPTRMFPNVFFYLLLHILFLLDTIGTFLESLVCMYVIFVLSTIRFVITRLGIPALLVILQQLMLLLLRIIQIHFMQGNHRTINTLSSDLLSLNKVQCQLVS